MKQGIDAKKALDSLFFPDGGREVRQVAFLDAKGSRLRFYRQNCIQYASDMQGANFSVQSNMMLTNEVCNAMAAAFRAFTESHWQKGFGRA